MSKLQVTPMDQHLHFKGRELADDQTLADACVLPGIADARLTTIALVYLSLHL